MRIATALVGLALVTSACKTTTATTTTISGTPRLEPSVAAATAPAPAPAPATAWSAEGKWTVGIVAQGQSMEVTVELKKLADGTWAGVIGTAQFGAIPLSSVKVTGKQMVATFPVPTGDMGTMTLNFDGDIAEGEWSMPGDGSKVSGKRN
jgi:hypothetical protein